MSKEPEAPDNASNASVVVEKEIDPLIEEKMLRGFEMVYEKERIAE